MLFLEILRNSKKPKTAGAKAAPRWEPHHWIIVGVTAWTSVYVFAFERLGYMLATLIFLLGLMAYFNRGRWLMNVTTALLFVLISYFSFTKLLGVSLARGIIPF
jgi:putative tricarboxylic transport membrane protein